ncbi:DUF423 domain-containing protein [Alcanivorax quisquiliarum]|uniref:DUF423 domain-containing protein n=1 Tax=Alcanivorax quisquiliarum TaxID=2933565 RepID=A0ABT0E5H3_9GAMM|nr:DUF423 domain-containing protein [Alcanivorax quisquiliarum]MCK0537030.1 DUF423 domain-containing protein [Alcanivorax quisquiliarum]
MKSLLILGTLNAALAVICGAFGAHGLKARVDSALLETWATASDYHLYHALALLLAGVLARQFGAAGIVTAGWILFAGMVVFSGSLYLLVLTGQRWLGAITPLGGTALIIGWLWLAWALYRAA